MDRRPAIPNSIQDLSGKSPTVAAYCDMYYRDPTMTYEEMLEGMVAALTRREAELTKMCLDFTMTRPMPLLLLVEG